MVLDFKFPKIARPAMTRAPSLADITSALNIVFDVAQLHSNPSAQSAVLLARLAQWMGASGAAAYEVTTAEEPADVQHSVQYCWSDLDTSHVQSKLTIATKDGRSPALHDRLGCSGGIALLMRSTAAFYACSMITLGPDRAGTIVVKRTSSPFVPEHAHRLNAFHRSAPARLLHSKSPTKSSDTLAPRVQQTLAWLKEGRSEKEIALGLGISRHTVHGYVKRLYQHFRVASRGELLSLWVGTEQTRDSGLPSRQSSIAPAGLIDESNARRSG